MTKRTVWVVGPEEKPVRVTVEEAREFGFERVPAPPRVTAAERERKATVAVFAAAFRKPGRPFVCAKCGTMGCRPWTCKAA